MKTRFSSLVTVKKSAMDKSEKFVQQTNAELNSATMALELSYSALSTIEMPNSGTISNLLATRTLFTSARVTIKQNQEWISFAKQQVHLAKEQLKLDMIEYEKFKYLELEEIKKLLKKIKLEEAKELDEIALITHFKKSKKESY